VTIFFGKNSHDTRWVLVGYHEGQKKNKTKHDGGLDEK
jgi:hypothetical protein